MSTRFTLKSIFVINYTWKNALVYQLIIGIVIVVVWLPKFTIRNVNRICLYTEPQGGRRTRDSVICCEASFAVQHPYIADLLGRCSI
jgi:hypothetical protein